MRRALQLIAGCVAAGSFALVAAAQNDQPRRARPDQPAGDRPARPDGQQRPALSPEKAKAAWELEATGVSKRLGVTADQTKAVVKAYADSRQSLQTTLDKMREERQKSSPDGAPGGAPPGGGGPGERDGGRPGGGPGGPGGGPEIQKAMETERAKLEKTLGSTLTAEQTPKAMASLGTFNRQWDVMVDTVAGFKLEASKQSTALDAMEDFVVAQGKMRSAGPDTDREARRTAMQESRQKLLDSMKKVLSEEQLKTFEQTIRGGMRGPGGGAPRDSGGGGG